MRNDPVVVSLVTRAAGDDQEAWNELVERYVPLARTCARRVRPS